MVDNQVSMLRVDVKQAKSGMTLALPVFNPAAPSQVLLRVGYSLTDDIITKLTSLGIRNIWVQYPSLDFLDKFLNVETVQIQSEVITQISNTFEQLQSESSAKLRYDEYTNAIEHLVDHMIGNPQAAVFLGDIASESDELMRHSSAVTYLALLMGLKLEGYIVRERRHVKPMRAKEVQNLGLGAMLHDIGITQLPNDIREHHTTTGDESNPPWREHTSLGYLMVRGQVDPTAANVVLHHHQRYDGSGWTGADYPVLYEKRIHVFSRITALADLFDRMRHPANLPEQPTVWVLASLLSKPLIHQFDPQAISALLAIAPPYPPGSIVQLSDGRHAVCIDHNPDHPCRPTVQIMPPPDALDSHNAPLGEMMDLTEVPKHLRIVEIDGHDVATYNFKLPATIGTPQPSAAWL